MDRRLYRRLRALGQTPATPLLSGSDQPAVLNNYLSEYWSWLQQQRRQAVADISPATPAQVREAKRQSTEISLQILQDELMQQLAPPPLASGQ